MNNGSVADMSEMSVEGFITGGQKSVYMCECVFVCLVGLSLGPRGSTAKAGGNLA